MDIEQLDLGDPHPPDDTPSPAGSIGPVAMNPLVWVLIAVIALVAGLLVLGRGGTPEPELLPTPVPSARPVLPPVPGPNQRQYLGVTTICGPVTDGRHTLAATFEVSNVSSFPITVDRVAGALPQGGLRQRGPATRGGSCQRPGTRGPAGSLEAGQSEYFTLTFDLPRTCPARYPVQVRIAFQADGFDETSLSILYGDLSVPDFDSCGPGEAQAGSAGWFIRS